MRSLLGLSCLLLSAGSSLAAIPGVEERKDIAYAGTTDPRQKLDLYLPKNRSADKPLPLVIFIHGGAWKGGDKSSGAGVAAPLAASGLYAVASIGYRFSSQAIWPAQIHDCKAAVRYLRANAKELGLDPTRFAVSGMSAGGHLALLIGFDGDSRKLEGDEGAFPNESSKVSCVLNWFGPVDIVSMVWPGGQLKKREQAVNALDELFGGPVEKHRDAAAEASPVNYISAGDPPVFTAHGTLDLLVPYTQATELNAALEKAKVPSFLNTLEGAGHGFQNNELNRRIGNFLGRYLYNLPAAIGTTPLKPE